MYQKIGRIGAVIALLALLVAGCAQRQHIGEFSPPDVYGMPGPGPAPGGGMIVYNTTDLHWLALDPAIGQRSPRFAILQRDIATGGVQFLAQLPANYHAPLHYHASDHSITVLQGQIMFDAGGQRRTVHQHGYAYFGPAMRHETWTGDEPALLLITSRGAFDFHWLEGERAGQHQKLPLENHRQVQPTGPGQARR